ncbi:MAG: hypothetical protein GAK33_06159 [Burkholderia lata]|uniref:Uncharacterized protein n=1 Tax=Burkholderia lata (strain ATCC 17760 / DSM 23089 / LMG 22485 / NCIMB 9086 / R18194 / 383) TaxID=482957 RepID=A0A833PMB4_BURL3|nr:MAG: hypothetical protein GAK33_06159 [Burkholderia lata]
MSTFSFLGIFVALGLVVAWTIIFLRKMSKEKKVAWSDVKTWLKNVVDSLFGVG